MRKWRRNNARRRRRRWRRDRPRLVRKNSTLRRRPAHPEKRLRRQRRAGLRMHGSRHTQRGASQAAASETGSAASAGAGRASRRTHRPARPSSMCAGRTRVVTTDRHTHSEWRALTVAQALQQREQRRRALIWRLLLLLLLRRRLLSAEIVGRILVGVVDVDIGGGNDVGGSICGVGVGLVVVDDERQLAEARRQAARSKLRRQRLCRRRGVRLGRSLIDAVTTRQQLQNTNIDTNTQRRRDQRKPRRLFRRRTNFDAARESAQTARIDLLSLPASRERWSLNRTSDAQTRATCARRDPWRRVRPASMR